MLIMAALPNRPLATPSMPYLGRYRKPSKRKLEQPVQQRQGSPQGASMGSTR